MYEATWQRTFRQFKAWSVGTLPGNSARHARPSMALMLVWLSLVASGVGALSLYEFHGATPVLAANRWPENALLTLDGMRPTLVFFMHPRCPCTGASLAELDRVLSRNAGRLRAYVVVTIPPGAGPRWEEGRNLDAAHRLPDTTLVFDRGGALTRSFGAVDSGTMMVFDASGTRCFAGGITASRGHEGESTGSEALRAIANGHAPSSIESPVFGCPLLGDSASKGGAL